MGVEEALAVGPLHLDAESVKDQLVLAATIRSNDLPLKLEMNTEHPLHYNQTTLNKQKSTNYLFKTFSQNCVYPTLSWKREQFSSAQN